MAEAAGARHPLNRWPDGGPLKSADPASPFDFLPAGALAALLAEPPAFRAVVGPLAIELYATGPRILGLASGALAHAVSDAPREETVRVALVDCAECGIPIPPPVPGTEALKSPYDEVTYRRDGRVTAIHQAESRTWQAFNAVRGIGLIYTADARRVAPWEWAAPVKCIIEWATEGRPFGLLHGAALARGDGAGVILAGGTGVGKSTTTAAAVLRGLKTAGDDVALVEWRDDGAILAHAAYDSLKVGATSLALLKGAVAAEGEAVGPGIAKHMLRLSDVAPDALVGAVRLGAVLLPRLAGGAETIIRPAGAGASLRALGPVSSYVMRVAPQETFRRASRLARDLPAFALDLSSDPMEAADRIAAFLRSLEGRA